jgi:hypothetical protein
MVMLGHYYYSNHEYMDMMKAWHGMGGQSLHRAGASAWYAFIGKRHILPPPPPQHKKTVPREPTNTDHSKWRHYSLETDDIAHNTVDR